LLSSVQPAAARSLMIAGLACFAARGYHATTTRDISTGSGMSPAALYVHYASKEELLYHVSRLAHASALNLVEEAAEGEPDPIGRVRAYMRGFTVWHAQHHTLARVAQYELSALVPEHRDEVAKMRRKTEAVLRSAIQDGVRSGVFSVSDVRSMTRAILSLGIDVARWFRDDADLTPTALGDLYAVLALRMLGVTDCG
jgi:AcrR family transcriptional regulator